MSRKEKNEHKTKKINKKTLNNGEKGSLNRRRRGEDGVTHFFFSLSSLLAFSILPKLVDSSALMCLYNFDIGQS